MEASGQGTDVLRRRGAEQRRREEEERREREENPANCTPMKTWSSSPLATPRRSCFYQSRWRAPGPPCTMDRRQSPMLLHYDLAAENIVAHRELPHPGFHGQYPYSWGGYIDIDLAVDEKGLWAIYSTEKARGVDIISQLDPENLRVIRSWETNIQKNKVVNAFMVGGTVA
ncbi:myocilin-like isoform X1 [Tachysurus ichikawai]